MTQRIEPMFTKPRQPGTGLGRVYMPNPGSRQYPLAAAVPRRGAISWKSKTWRMGNGLRYRDQGSSSTCVRYGLLHLLQLTPIIRADAFQLTTKLYAWAQNNDPWPGSEPTYYGTSVDAGLRYLRHFDAINNLPEPPTRTGLIKEYRWAYSMDEVITRLSLPAKEGGGPMVVGTDFYSGMDVYPENGDGYVQRNQWTPSGNVLGGHCYVLDGQTAPTARKPRQILIGNSHDQNFRATMDAEAMEWLLFAQNGEAAAVTETPK
jgi:hypothetical protein